MLTEARIDLIGRIARLKHAPNELGSVIAERSVLALAAVSYGAKPDANSTSPTGFDPRAVLLFEAIVEGAFLVASADGLFDESERDTFGRIVTAACGGAVPPRRIAKLVLDLGDMLQEDGLEVRLKNIVESAGRHLDEVLRIGALIADASGGVQYAERQVLEKMAAAARLPSSAVDQAIDDVRRELRAAGA
ncbi:MAG: tellurite resistance TerB family protein [Myxococcales bacterium]|nr:tellurite resistance TerB family protein [Myxococcales bacterium]